VRLVSGTGAVVSLFKIEGLFFSEEKKQKTFVYLDFSCGERVGLRLWRLWVL
jgi:hypothetical protein